MATPPMPPAGGAPAGGIMPDEDLAPLFAELEAAGGAPGESEMGAEGEAGALEMPGAEGTEGPVDLAEMAKMMRIPVEKAQEYYDEAQNFDNLAGLPPTELAGELLANMQQLLQLEEAIAEKYDSEAEMGMYDDEEESVSEPEMGKPGKSDKGMM